LSGTAECIDCGITTTTTTSSSTSTTTTTSSSSTSTTTTTTTATPTTTTTTTSNVFYNVDYRPSELANTGQQIQFWYSTNFGSTWTLFNTSITGISEYPLYDLYVGLQISQGTTVYLALTDTSGNDIQYGSGNTSGDFTSLCGKSNPLIIPSLSSNTQAYFNINVSGGNFVPCNTPTTTTTTSSSTSTTTTTTTAIPGPTTTTTTSSSTSTTTTTTTPAPQCNLAGTATATEIS
jgi:hypothetical protein